MDFDVKDKRILVIGLARSGVAAAGLLAKKGARVAAADRKPLEELSAEARALGGMGVTIAAGGEDARVLDHVDLVVLSPGVPRTAPLPAEADRRRIPVIGELELAARYARAPIVAVTGTNGKSTTVTWIGFLLHRLGYPVVVAGNVGTALSGVVEEIPASGVLVVEVSSFQLESTDTFRPKVGVVLNLRPDHLDRYPSVAEYYGAKERLCRRQTPDDVVVLNAADAELMKWAPGLKARVVTFGGSDRQRDGVICVDGMIARSGPGGVRPIAPVAGLGIPGPHNVDNAMASLAALHGLSVDLTDPRVAAGLREFKGLEHRIEYVGELNGVRFYNDSKATNTDSLAVALESFSSPIVLIAGGRDKKGDFAALRDSVGRHVGAVVTVGEAASTIRAAWGNAVTDWVEAGRSFERAVEAAYQEAFARQGVVLLSPGCASYDMFTDYEDRGRRFKELARSLGAERRDA